MKSYQAKKGQFIPKEGKLVVYDSQKPIEKDGVQFLKVRYPSSGRELEIPVKNLLVVKQSEILKSAGPNAQIRYQQRHAEILFKVKEMSQYADTLTTKLDELAGKDPTPLLNVTNTQAE